MTRLLLLATLACAFLPGHAQNQRIITDNLRTTAGCHDTSFSKLIGIQDMYLDLYSSTRTKEDGTLVTGAMNDTTTATPFVRTYGFLMKLDKKAQVLWTKKFEELTPGFNFITQTRAFELNNGDIIFTAQWTTDGASFRWNTIIVKLTANGNEVWRNCLKTNLTVLNLHKGELQFQPESAADGLNGDVILGGTSYAYLQGSRFATAVRLNSAGNLVWDVNFGNISGNTGEHRLGVHGVQIWMQNGEVGFAALNNGTGTVLWPMVSLMTLNYTNGALQSGKFHLPDYEDFLERNKKKFADGYGKFIRLNNGNFIFYGRIFAESYGLPLKEQFGVMEFYPDFSLRDAYTIASGVSTNWELSQVQFHPSGKGAIALYSYLGPKQADIFIGSFEGRIFSKQRVIHYDAALPNFAGLMPQNDSSYVLVQGFFDNPPARNSYVGYNRLHNVDTSSVCLGKDTSLFSVLPLKYKETLNFLDPTISDTLEETAFNLSITNAKPTHTHDRCRQITICDTLKIHGNGNICGNQPYIDFTSYKNIECSKKVEWEIDNNAIDSLRHLSDSSVRIYFKNQNWKGKLFASIPSSDCNISPIDSMEVTIIRGQQALDLGADKDLCPQNTIRLHAGNTYSSYLWQNGSTDRILNVTTAGKYWVSTHDICGNNFSDTVLVAFLNTSVDLGPDRLKCNNDTLHLDAPAGFLNYNWSNNYNISSTSGQQVVVYPLTDTAYYLAAEKKAGCFAYDTIRIQVKSSPAIYLGADTSFCAGDSIVLNAGTGFQNYLWSNGETDQQITVHLAGEYSIAAAYDNGCHSRDTLRVPSVYPKPSPALDHDPTLCNGEIRTLTAGNFVSYLWHNGTTSPTFEASAPGIYYVTVEDEHNCIGSDTVEITTLKECLKGFYVPNAFTPNDDGNNDVFKPVVGGKLLSYELTIYNRYGQQIFSSNNLQHGWDGTIAGKKQDSNLFIWACRYKLEGQEE